MDTDGTRSGYDLDLLRAATTAVRIPVIASGGAGNLAHLDEALTAGAHAVLAASIFHFGEISLGEARDYLADRGHEVRK
jgi:cyclase